MANFPTSAFSAAAKSAGQVIQSAHVNEITDEVTAIEQALLGTGTPSLSIGGNLTVGGSLTIPAPSSYSPTWGNTGTANTLGNGSLSGLYVQIGDLTFFHVYLTWGSTTASGNGSWYVTLPFASSASAAGAAVVCDLIDVSVPAQYVGGGNGPGASGSNISLVTLPSTALTATSPFTWASGDVMRVVGWYFSA